MLAETRIGDGCWVIDAAWQDVQPLLIMDDDTAMEKGGCRGALIMPPLLHISYRPCTLAPSTELPSTMDEGPGHAVGMCGAMCAYESANESRLLQSDHIRYQC